MRRLNPFFKQMIQADMNICVFCRGWGGHEKATQHTELKD